MKCSRRYYKLFVTCMLLLSAMYVCKVNVKAANPYLPLWEYIPDGEPHIFEDPENPGKYRAYIIGSHDTRRDAYCGPDIVAWSAPVEDLTQWRYDGVIFESIVNGVGDILFAPDMVEKVEVDGTKTYYLYPNNQGGGRNSMVAKSNSPVGPFTVINYVKGSNSRTEGVLGFDPAVFIDDDGRVYGYWGFEQSNAAELNPETMYSVKPGTSVIEKMIPNKEAEGVFRFFEASSMRKIKDKYVFIYSRSSAPGEFGLSSSNCTLAYAYSESPLGPWTYGGTLVDSRIKDKDFNGNIITVGQSWGNTHGSLLEINGQWYVFYHRATNNSMFSRQAMVSAIEVEVEEGPGGKVIISEAEVTSEGFEINGLSPYKNYSAGIACWYTGGAYIKSTYDKDVDTNPVVNTVDGSVVGFKYFNFDVLAKNKENKVVVNLTPKGKEGSIEIMLDSPWPSKGGTLIGTIEVSKDDPKVETLKEVVLQKMKGVTGKHAIFFVFHTSGGGAVADFNNFRFSTTDISYTVGSEREEVQWISNEKVMEFIDAIGSVTYSDESMSRIKQARKAYEIVHSNQRGNITNSKVLVDAEQSYLDVKRDWFIESGKNYTGSFIENGGFENGTYPWTQLGTATIEIVDRKDTNRKKVLHLFERTGESGVVQDITGRLVIGSEYEVSMWVMYELGKDTRDFQLVIRDGSGVDQVIASEVVAKGPWTELRSVFTLDAGIDLSSVKMIIQPVSSSDVLDYYIDDVVFSKMGDQEAADAVILLIEAIGKVKATEESKALIDTARTAYDGLAQTQKSLVSNRASLFDAEMVYVVREKEAATKKETVDSKDQEEELVVDTMEVTELDSEKTEDNDGVLGTIFIIFGVILVIGSVGYFLYKRYKGRSK